MNWNYCFIIAGILWALEMFPQLVKTYKTKKTGDISIFFPSICLLSFLVFFVGCIGTKNWILLGSHIVPFLCILSWLIMILIYRKNK